MSSQLALLQIPDDEMREILARCDFESVLTLRKVCHPLRDFIDTVKPLQLSSIDIGLRKENFITLEITHKIKNKQRFLAEYRSHEESQDETSILLKESEFVPIIVSEDGVISREPKRVLVVGQQFEETFSRDLQLISSSQKSHLKSVHFNVKSLKLLETFQNFDPLKTEKIEITTENQSEILEVFKFISLESLKTIEIQYEDPGGLSEELKNSEHWKRAKNVEIHDFYLGRMNDLMDFEKVTVHCEKFPLAHVVHARDKFLASSTLIYFEIQFGWMEPGIYDELGHQHHADNPASRLGRRRWFYKIPNSHKIMYLSSYPRSVSFGYIEREKIPKGGVILRL